MLIHRKANSSIAKALGRLHKRDPLASSSRKVGLLEFHRTPSPAFAPPSGYSTATDMMISPADPFRGKRP